MSKKKEKININIIDTRKHLRLPQKIGIGFGGVLLLLVLLLLAAYIEPMFEGRSIKCDTVAGSAEWMSALPDEELISDVSLPGTHDAATEYVQLAYFSKCQALSIGEQLEAGYRYLDIRLGIDYDESGAAHMMLMHGFTKCKTGNGPSADTLYLENVLSQVYEFLDENPSEGIVFVVKQEHGDESVSEFQAVLNSYIEQNPDYWCLTDSVPTVGEMRGKILLCRRYGDEAGYGDAAGLSLAWIDQTGSEDTTLHMEAFEEDTFTLFVQDRYEYKSSDKWNAYQNALQAVQTQRKEGDILINFTSTKGTLKYGHPHHYSASLDKKLADYDFENADFTGWTIVDFGTPELAEKIYSQN